MLAHELTSVDHVKTIYFPWISMSNIFVCFAPVILRPNHFYHICLCTSRVSSIVLSVLLCMRLCVRHLRICMYGVYLGGWFFFFTETILESGLAFLNEKTEKNFNIQLIFQLERGIFLSIIKLLISAPKVFGFYDCTDWNWGMLSLSLLVFISTWTWML